jgi:uncharacterized membrane-anchored protein
MSLAYRSNADFASLNHAMRVPLSAEIHSRPFLQLQAPESLTHFALYLQQDQPSRQNHRASQHHPGAAMPALRRGRPHAQARYFFHDFGRFRLKWECHTEFATYTFVERASLIRLARWPCSMPLQHVPQEWLAGLHGKIIVAAHVVLCKGRRRRCQLGRHPRTVSGQVAGRQQWGGNAEVWTDFLIQPDGFSRFVVRDLHLREFQPAAWSAACWKSKPTA